MWKNANPSLYNPGKIYQFQDQALPIKPQVVQSTIIASSGSQSDSTLCCLRNRTRALWRSARLGSEYDRSRIPTPHHIPPKHIHTPMNTLFWTEQHSFRGLPRDTFSSFSLHCQQSTFDYSDHTLKRLFAYIYPQRAMNNIKCKIHCVHYLCASFEYLHKIDGW